MSDAKSYNTILLDVVDRVATVSFNRPDSLNALVPEMLAETGSVIDDIAEGRVAARALVITGAGRAFGAGADLAAGGSVGASREDRDLGAVLESDYHPFLLKMRHSPVPIVSAVKGPVAGASMSVALSADMIVAGESAYFLQAFRNIGLVPDAGATWLLPRLIGRPRAMELSLLGDKLPAKTAYEWGVVNRLVADEQALPEAQTIAKRLADGPTLALAAIRDLYWRAETASYEEQLENERQAQRRMGHSEDSEEGVKAFLEKRPAVFQGR